MIKVYDKKQDCCGCTACKSICPQKAITMQPDEEGFLYPQINEVLCVDCNLCKLVCPFQNGVKIQGHLCEPLVYAIKHRSDNVRMSSSSGGAYTAVSDRLLSREEENSFAIYGAEFNRQNGFAVRHKGASTITGRDSFRGSKYVQSDLEEVFIEIRLDLLAGKTVLFTGTPCQTAGLSNYIQKTASDMKDGVGNLILNDLVCHGVPSPLLWKHYLEFIQNKRQSRLQEYTFRFKAKGWRGDNVRAVFENGRSEINSEVIQTYAKLFGSDLILRPSCYNCKFANLSRPSDLTIGDFWGIEKSLPEMDDNKGVSLVLINTAKGKEIFEQIKKDINLEQSNPIDCLQLNLEQPTKKPPNRERFWMDYQCKGFAYISKKYKRSGFLGKIKMFVAKILRRFGLLAVVKRSLSR